MLKNILTILFIISIIILIILINYFIYTHFNFYILIFFSILALAMIFEMLI